MGLLFITANKMSLESDTYLELVIESGFLMTIKQSSIIFACPPPPVLAVVLLHIFSDSKLFSCISILSRKSVS